MMSLRESGGTKVVADLELPHTGEHLGDASVEDSQASDHTDGSTGGNTSTDVEEGEND